MNLNNKEFISPTPGQVDYTAHPLRGLAPDTWKNIPQ